MNKIKKKVSKIKAKSKRLKLCNGKLCLETRKKWKQKCEKQANGKESDFKHKKAFKNNKDRRYRYSQQSKPEKEIKTKKIEKAMKCKLHLINRSFLFFWSKAINY